MPNSEITFKDRDGFRLRHPERSCKRCKKYPCVSGMEKLKGNFASYGCYLYEDANTFDSWKPKK